MKLLCIFGFHKYDGCKCSACGKIRDQDHDWSEDCEKCLICDKVRVRVLARDEGHFWVSGKCAKCGKADTGVLPSPTSDNYPKTFRKFGKQSTDWLEIVIYHLTSAQNAIEDKGKQFSYDLAMQSLLVSSGVTWTAEHMDNLSLFAEEWNEAFIEPQKAKEIMKLVLTIGFDELLTGSLKIPFFDAIDRLLESENFWMLLPDIGSVGGQIIQELMKEEAARRH